MTLQTRLQDLATRVATECKSIRTITNGNAADLSGLTTTAKSNLVAAINELKIAVDAAAFSGGVVINDASTNTTEAWSGSKINSELSAGLAALVGGSSAALDTLQEFATALGNDANFATTTATALGNRVRVDTAQGLTTAQKTTARTNIGAQEAALIGDPDTNFVTTFTTGLT